jgi:hypothetical protein
VVTIGAPVLFRATLHNFGANRADGVRARLTSDGRIGPEQSLELPAAADTQAIFRQQFDTEGDHRVEVTIDDDPLKTDNTRYLTVPVRESLKVLLIDGQPNADAYKAETDYLAQALAPTEESPGQPRPIRVEAVSESWLRTEEPANYDVVVLCNVGQFSEPEVTKLEEFLKQGGGVVFFGGDQVLAENYNRLLYAGGKGLLPAEIGPTMGEVGTKKSGYFLNPLGYRHPIVAPYQGETEPVTSGLTQALTFQYHKLNVPNDSTAEVAIKFDTNDPAIIQSKRHQGVVIMVATTADMGWTTWPVHKSYPPVMQEIVLQAAAGKMADRNIRVGQPFDQSFPSAGAAAPVTVVPPRGAPVSAKLQPAGGISRLHFEKTDIAGNYQVRVGPPLTLESSFAANTDPAESDPAKLDEARLKEQLPGWNFSYRTDARALAQDASSVRSRGEWHRPLLHGLLILLLVESLLAWKFGHHESTS